MSNYNLARNHNTSPETLARLANDDDYWVCNMVAENPNTPPETLDLLVVDGNSLNCYCVACNINTLPETLERLANYGDQNAHIALALNFFTPQYIKDYLKIKKFLNYNTR
jgi:hypothetical protein